MHQHNNTRLQSEKSPKVFKAIYWNVKKKKFFLQANTNNKETKSKS